MKTTMSALAMIAATLVAHAEPTAAIPAGDLKKAMQIIEDSNKHLFEAIDGLTPEQWSFKPAPDRWSAAETLEHLTIIQDLVLGILSRLDQAPAAPAGRDLAKMDAELVPKVEDRSTKFTAPPQAVPTGKWTPAETIAHFKESNTKLKLALETQTGLRAHVFPHPIMGPLDGYQWILITAAHTWRHTDQILEVKAASGFPH